MRRKPIWLINYQQFICSKTYSCTLCNTLSTTSYSTNLNQKQITYTSPAKKSQH